MPAQKDRDWRVGELPEDFLRLPGVLALRVTIRPDAAGYAWCADAAVLPGAAPARLVPRPTNGAAQRDTRVLDEIFAGGL
jgi:hypothetical protein